MLSTATAMIHANNTWFISIYIQGVKGSTGPY